MTIVDVEREKLYARSEDVDDLAASTGSDVVRLLPGFDQYVLSPGTTDPRIIAPSRRAAVSRAGGWIAPVVVSGGVVAGTWATADDRVEVSLFSEAGDVSRAALEREVQRLAAVSGTRRRLSVTTPRPGRRTVSKDPGGSGP